MIDSLLNWRFNSLFNGACNGSRIRLFDRVLTMSVTLLSAILALLCAAVPARADNNWPNTTVRVIVPFAPGASNDVIARQLAIQLTKSLGQSFVVENRPGGGSTIGAQSVASAEPNGYTLLFVSSSLATSAAVQKTPYDPIKAFRAVSQVASAPFLIITRQDFPAKTVPELVTMAKANPGKINFGTSGLGDNTHLATELLAATTGIKMTAISYKGIAPALIDLMAGRTDLIITSIASIRGTVAENLPKMAFTSAKRDPDFPNVPTVRDEGIDYIADLWWGVFAPADTPTAIVNKLNVEINKIVATSEFARFLKNSGALPAASTPSAFQALLTSEVIRWGDTARRAGLEQK